MIARWQVLIPFLVTLFISPYAAEWKSNGSDCVGVPSGQTPEHTGNANIIVDEVLKAVSDYLRKFNYTEIDISDQEADFEFFLLHGHLSLSEGKVSGYDKIERFGYAPIDYFDKGTTGSAAVKFADASFYYNIEARITNTVFQGTIKAYLEELIMRINMSVNLTSLCQTIDSVKVENLNSIRVQTDIKWIPRTLSDTIVNTVIWIYKNRLVPSIEERTARAIQDFLDTIDLDDLLRPPHQSTPEIENNYGERTLSSPLPT